MKHTKSFQLGPKQIDWIRALKSEKYPQGQYTLNNGESFCCLGVLCEVVEFKKTGDSSSGYLYGGSKDLLNTSQRRKIGLTKEGMNLLSRLNDIYRASFSQIAYELQKYPKSYFFKGV